MVLVKKKTVKSKINQKTSKGKVTPKAIVKKKPAVKTKASKSSSPIQKTTSAKKTAVKKVTPSKKAVKPTKTPLKKTVSGQKTRSRPSFSTPAPKTAATVKTTAVKRKPAAFISRAAVSPLFQDPSVAAAAIVKKKIVYNPGEFVVYPTHGVGRISEISTKKVGGQDLELVVVHFDKSRMTLRVPLEKAPDSLRKISDKSILQNALSILQQKPKVKKAMWSRRQQEYETKINSGDPKLLAEVIRDLHRRHQMADQSYTERQIYETAFDRLAHELAAADKTDTANAGEKIKRMLSQPAF